MPAANHKSLKEPQWLINSAKLEDVIFASNVAHLDVLPSGPVPPNPAELLSNARLNEMFDYIHSVYDYIIIDTAPIGLISDGFILMRHSHINLYVIRHGVTEKKWLEKNISVFMQR